MAGVTDVCCVDYRRTDSLKSNQLDNSSPPAEVGGGSVGGAIASSELELLKQEILTEMRKEMNKMKLEILDGTYAHTSGPLI